MNQNSDIVIPGTPTEPDAPALELANMANGQLKELIRKTKDYYSPFIDLEHAEPEGEPSLVSVSSRKSLSQL